MRILFFGVYSIGVRSLSQLLESGADVVAVVTKPGTESDGQPVADWAASRNIRVLQPSTPAAPEFLTEVTGIRPDLIVVAGYHRIIPKSVLSVPPLGAINLHGSLLPEYRGPCTWKWAILNGEAHTGVTVHVMTPELDNGDILRQRKIPIEEEDTGGSLFEKISTVGAELLAETVQGICRGTVVPTPQEESLASYYGYPTEEESAIRWARSGRQIRDLVRGLSPRPGAWTRLGSHRLRVWKAALTAGKSMESPGTVVGISSQGLQVATGTEDLLIQSLSLDGRTSSGPVELASYLGLRTGGRFSAA
jgi:methionyl-tRNA formyltransferase